ncbi:hypothetical protein EV182_001683 [Spiromyces aspiralis]|uniref:Uncharacterized protein n=1 Tax=Spiromyces aspiralis TaxID=68401 RepID=A0ACC1HWA6_9FUNG|nr:hypothetical protein EV182_001683 [Spiromyces aspiralis]
MSATYELIAFPNQGRAEICRNILRHTRATWTETNPKWPADKATMPFEKVPVLVETKSSGKKLVLSESQVIERYLAHSRGLYPKHASLETIAKIDQYRDQFTDIFTLFTIVFYGKHHHKRPDLLSAIQFLVKKHELALKANGSNGHYIGSSTTYVDIVAYTLIKMFKDKGFGERLTARAAPELNRLIDIIGSEIHANLPSRTTVSSRL